ncbi:hypothetical protein GWK47_042367 [Chionoecetes opilio]|uniref:Uncharacterized protein n=1 Tax=Chionoecetes opilio TaxID=41210 RepID=A0A8J5CWQ9_CHIOP|nr:hypothetical protein GWK47_042367 [Chionoecetes opilio]
MEPVNKASHAHLFPTLTTSKPRHHHRIHKATPFSSLHCGATFLATPLGPTTQRSQNKFAIYYVIPLSPYNHNATITLLATSQPHPLGTPVNKPAMPIYTTPFSHIYHITATSPWYASQQVSHAHLYHTLPHLEDTRHTTTQPQPLSCGRNPRRRKSEVRSGVLGLQAHPWLKIATLKHVSERFSAINYVPGWVKKIYSRNNVWGNTRSEQLVAFKTRILTKIAVTFAQGPVTSKSGIAPLAKPHASSLAKPPPCRPHAAAYTHSLLITKPVCH